MRRKLQPKVLFSIRIRQNTRELLENIAEKRDISLNELIRGILENYCSLIG